MIEEQTIEVSSKEFLTFVRAIENVNNNGVSVTIHRDYIDALCLSDDNSSIILYEKIVIINSADIKEESIGQRLNIKDFKKFKMMLAMNNSKTFIFTVRRNAVYFHSKKIKSAKFTLGEIPYSVSKNITAEWFQSFTKEMRMEMPREELLKLATLSRFTSSDVSKIYFEMDETGENLLATVDDKEIMNTDSVVVEIGKPDFGALRGSVIIRLKSFESLALDMEEVLVESANISSTGKPHEVLFISYKNDNISVNYLLNSLRS